MGLRGVCLFVALGLSACGARSHLTSDDVADGDADSDVGESGLGNDLALGDLTSEEWRSLCEWGVREFAGCDTGTVEDCLDQMEFWAGCDATIHDYETCLTSAVACEWNEDNPACQRLVDCVEAPYYYEDGGD